MQRRIAVFIKILFTVLIALCTAVGVVLVHFLPIESKSLKWNLDARFYCYCIPLIIYSVIFVLSCYLFGQDGEVSDEHFTYEISAFIGIFLVVFFSDRYAVKKRIKPYIKKHPEEYKKYDEQNTGRCRFAEGISDSFAAALFLTAALGFYYMIFWLTEPV